MSSGQLRKHEQFRSRFLRNQRDLIVYTPPGYADRSRRHFPVLYLHDGQNLFDGATSFIPGQDWHVGQTADQYIQAGVVAPLIIVGMYNTKARIREYTPTQVPKLGGGRADRYAKFLIEEVKPFVDREYCTLSGSQHTGIGGSSLGGLVSLYLGLQHSCIFGKIAARFVRTATAEPRPRIWLDIGTREGPRIVQDVEKFRDVLLEKGWKLGNDLHYERVEDAEHNEVAWARRVGPFLQFLYPAYEAAV
ncbi:MAG: esterase [Acidobacteria bacterium]|nr:MAG: esterase [Acidobacteriota bacterium]